MRKTANWSFGDIVRIGADDLLNQNQAKSFQDGMQKAAAAVLWVIRDEFISQLPKSLAFDNDKFCIAVFDDNDTVVVSYDGIVFEVHQKDGPIRPGFIGFVLVNPSDERLTPYLDKLKRIKDKSRTIRDEMRKAKIGFDVPVNKNYLN